MPIQFQPQKVPAFIYRGYSLKPKRRQGKGLWEQIQVGYQATYRPEAFTLDNIKQAINTLFNKPKPTINEPQRTKIQRGETKIQPRPSVRTSWTRGSINLRGK